MRRILCALALLSAGALGLAAQSGYEAYGDDCPCRYLGVGVPWSEYSDPVKLTALIDGKAEAYILVDVRRPDEFAAGHIPTAINVPVDEIGSRTPTEQKDALIIVYCRSGVRSARAAATLKELGYKGVVDFGGMDRWKGSVAMGPSKD